MSCSGDANETCGGRLAISVYEYTGYAGCFMDNVADRVLTGSSFVDNDMTAEVREISTRMYKAREINMLHKNAPAVCTFYCALIDGNVQPKHRRWGAFQYHATFCGIS